MAAGSIALFLMGSMLFMSGALAQEAAGDIFDFVDECHCRESGQWHSHSCTVQSKSKFCASSGSGKCTRIWRAWQPSLSYSA